MKLLVNLCAHDGIASHYAGVGTMVKRYIKAIKKYLDELGLEYKINLFSPVYYENSFGYSKTTLDEHKKLKNVEIFFVQNGTEGKSGFGNYENWDILCKNTAQKINSIDLDEYDKVITIFNDTPFAGLSYMLPSSNKHILVWIPHSTTKIFQASSKLENFKFIREKELAWESRAIEHINKTKFCYVGAICEYMAKHLEFDYKLKDSKILNITNGELFFENEKLYFDPKISDLFEKIKGYDSILLAFARAEEDKNLTGAMLLKRELGLPTIIIARTYGEYDPIIDEYKRLAQDVGCDLFVDPPFNFSQYILNNFSKNMVLLIPSEREPMGLIINEVRRLNRDNILIVANDRGGLREQIDDTKDGILVDLNNMSESAKKIKQYFNNYDIMEMNRRSQKVIRQKYDFYENLKGFITELLEENE